MRCPYCKAPGRLLTEHHYNGPDFMATDRRCARCHKLVVTLTVVVHDAKTAYLLAQARAKGSPDADAEQAS